MVFQVEPDELNVPTDTVAEIRPLGARIPPPPPEDLDGDTLPIVRPVRAKVIILAPPSTVQVSETVVDVPRAEKK